MVRSMMVVLTLTGTVAHAQENPEIARCPGATAPPGEGKVVLASRSPAPGRDAGSGAPDGGTDAGSAVKTIVDRTSPLVADCSVSEALLSGQAPAVRYYAAPPAPPNGQRNEWNQAPFVGSVVRCGQRFFLQVYSQSASSWVIDRARVEGPQGETPKVGKPQFRPQGQAWDINLIVAEAPPGVSLSMLTLHMLGEDGRVAQTTVKDLP